MATEGDAEDYREAGWRGSKVRESDKFKKQYRSRMSKKEYVNAQT